MLNSIITQDHDGQEVFNAISSFFRSFRVTIHGVFGSFLYLRIPIATKRHFNRPRQLKHSAGHMPVPKVSGFSIQACSFISPPATSPTGMFFLF